MKDSGRIAVMIQQAIAISKSSNDLGEERAGVDSLLMASVLEVARQIALIREEGLQVNSYKADLAGMQRAALEGKGRI